MFDPVIHAGGNIYERSVLVDWFKDHDTSPKSKKQLDHKFIIPVKDKRTSVKQVDERLTRGLAIFHKLMTKDHFPLAERLYAFMDKYNVVLKNNFSNRIIETLLSPEVIPKLIKDTPTDYV